MRIFWIDLTIIVVVLSCSAVLFPVTARADSLSLLADYEYIVVDNETRNKQTGEVAKTETDRFSQLYTLDLDKTLAPYLTFNAGGTFDLNETDSETDGSKRTNRDSQIRPYVGLELNNPYYRGGLDYRKSKLKNSGTGIAETRAFSEEFTASFNWRPSDLPKLNVEYVRTLAYDEPETRDSVNDSFNLSSRYDYKQYNFDFTHTRNDNRDKLTDFETQTRNYSGGVLYSDSFMNDSLSVNAGGKLDYSTTEFKGSGVRDIRTLPRGEGFYLLSDPFPDSNLPDEFTDVDINNQFENVNIGRSGGNSLLSFGLFFSNEVDVDLIRLPLLSNDSDPTIATPGQVASVANLFNWTLYISDDQLNWTEVAISSVEYDQFDNRFEIHTVQTISNEYFKVVIRPLDDAVAPGKILLRDVQAFTILEETSQSKVTSTNQYYNFGLDYRLSNKTNLGYDTYLQEQYTDPGSDRRRWSNGISLQHRFNPIFIGTSRLLRSDSWLNGTKDSTSHNFSTSLNAYYLKTFNQTLTYSLSHTDDSSGTSSSNAIVLRSNLDLYKGLSVSLDQGYAWQDPPDGGDVNSFFLRSRAHIVPHRRVDLNLDYSVTWDSEDQQPNVRTENGRFSGFWLVLDSLSLSNDINFRRTDTAGVTETRVLRDYAVSWSPLLQGALQFSVVYTESSSTDDDRADSFSQNIRWRLTNYALLTLSHTKGTNETDQEHSENESYFMNLRVYY